MHLKDAVYYSMTLCGVLKLSTLVRLGPSMLVCVPLAVLAVILVVGPC